MFGLSLTGESFPMNSEGRITPFCFISRLAAKILRVDVGLQFCVLSISVQDFFFFFFTKDFLLGRDFQEEITQMGFSQRVFCPPCCDLGVGTGVTCGL